MTTCVRCGAELADGYACVRCGIDRPTAQLADIRDMTRAARDIAHRLSRHDTGAGAAGKPGSQLPLDLGATSRLDAVQNALTTLARDVAETRGVQIALDAPKRGFRPDPLVQAATWLRGQLEWLRHAVDGEHEPWATHALGDIEACARVIRGLARGPAAQRYLGPCGAPTLCDVSSFDEVPGSSVVEGAPCEGDVYARVGTDGTTAATGTCRTCQATVDTAERRLWLDEEVRSRAFADTEIADAYGVKLKTIRSWATERPEVRNGAGKLVRSATPIRLHPHTHDRDSQPLYLVGEVLDLAAADAARRAGDQATRARRAATRAAETEGATA